MLRLFIVDVIGHVFEKDNIKEIEKQGKKV